MKKSALTTLMTDYFVNSLTNSADQKPNLFVVLASYKKALDGFNRHYQVSVHCSKQ